MQGQREGAVRISRRPQRRRRGETPALGWRPVRCERRGRSNRPGGTSGRRRKGAGGVGGIRAVPQGAADPAVQRVRHSALLGIRNTSQQRAGVAAVPKGNPWPRRQVPATVHGESGSEAADPRVGLRGRARRGREGLERVPLRRRGRLPRRRPEDTAGGREQGRKDRWRRNRPDNRTREETAKRMPGAYSSWGAVDRITPGGWSRSRRRVSTWRAHIPRELARNPRDRQEPVPRRLLSGHGRPLVRAAVHRGRRAHHPTRWKYRKYRREAPEQACEHPQEAVGSVGSERSGGDRAGGGNPAESLSMH